MTSAHSPMTDSSSSAMPASAGGPLLTTMPSPSCWCFTRRHVTGLSRPAAAVLAALRLFRRSSSALENIKPSACFVEGCDMTFPFSALLAAVLLVAACGSNEEPVAAEVVDPGVALNEMFEEYADRYLEMNPVQATFNGVNRYNDRMANSNSPEYRAAAEAMDQEFLRRLLEIDREQLSGKSRSRVTSSPRICSRSTSSIRLRIFSYNLAAARARIRSRP
jgi:hypothetical protein